MKVAKGLKLFIADIIDEEDNEQTIWYVVGKTYDSALKRFIKEANRIWNRYSYYFDEADDETVDKFINENEKIRVGVYYDC